jgi:glycerol-3-phosphate acyltransferase PlsX
MVASFPEQAGSPSPSHSPVTARLPIALDAMGGDNAPAAIIDGAILACEELGASIILVGDEYLIREELDRRPGSARLSLTVHHASQRVAMDEQPSQVVRRKRESSIWVATSLVKEGKASAVVSAGNTGASMATALFLLGRIPGVERPAIAALLPTLFGPCLLLDVGANVDCEAHNLLQFAVMGHIYVGSLLGRPTPKVGLLSIGEEETKGNELTKEAFKLLRDSPLNFIGNVEGRDIYAGGADVVVCDGFIGNVTLKVSEGLASTILKLLKREIAVARFGKLGYLLLRSAFGRFQKRVDYAEYGGAPLLGVNGISIICHGRSSGRAIKNAIRVATECVQQELHVKIRAELERLHATAAERAVQGGTLGP